MPFEKGKSGNPKGRGKDKHTMQALILEMKEREKSEDPKGMRKVAVVIWDLAEGGERWAAEFIRDTIDGKPKQAIVGDDDDDAIKVVTKIERHIVSVANKDG